MSRSNKRVVPECKSALDRMKYEIAAELGLVTGGAYAAGGAADTEFAGELGAVQGGGQIHWSEVSTRQAGSVGGEITRRLVAQAEQAMGGGLTL